MEYSVIGVAQRKANRARPEGMKMETKIETALRLSAGLGVAMNNAGAVSRCPECWLEDKVTMIETSPNEGFVSCPHHGEITARHFVSRMTEAEKELADRSQ